MHRLFLLPCIRRALLECGVLDAPPILTWKKFIFHLACHKHE